jgi:hypothetical protein
MKGDNRFMQTALISLPPHGSRQQCCQSKKWLLAFRVSIVWPEIPSSSCLVVGVSECCSPVLDHKDISDP